MGLAHQRVTPDLVGVGGITIDCGIVNVPDRPGLGIELDAKALEEVTVTPAKLSAHSL